MSPKTINDEKLQVTSNIQPDIEEVSDYCINFIVDIPSSINIIQHQELSEEEILSLPEKLGIFSFLEDEGEDIYNESDGVPIE